MRRITEFKGYRSIVDYDAETGQFIITPAPEAFSDDISTSSAAPVAEIVPFPEPQSGPQKQRLAG